MLALAFTIGLGIFTGLDFSRHGVTVPGVFSLLILVLFTFGIIGALTQPPRE
jgi:hypothetical protein